MTASASASRWLPILSAVAFLGAAAPAFADCQEDLGKIMKERQGLIESLNKMNKGGKGQLDPIAACPRLRNLAASENKVVAYLEKNKDWCNVPDNFLENAKAGRAKSVTFAAKACQVAGQVEKMKRQQAQQAANGGGNQQQVQRLPAGPL